jgi:hypothetical protein
LLPTFSPPFIHSRASDRLSRTMATLIHYICPKEKGHMHYMLLSCCAPWSWNWITPQLPLCLSYMERKGLSWISF